MPWGLPAGSRGPRGFAPPLAHEHGQAQLRARGSFHAWRNRRVAIAQDIALYGRVQA